MKKRYFLLTLAGLLLLAAGSLFIGVRNLTLGGLLANQADQV